MDIFFYATQSASSTSAGGGVKYIIGNNVHEARRGALIRLHGLEVGELLSISLLDIQETGGVELDGANALDHLPLMSSACHECE